MTTEVIRLNEARGVSLTCYRLGLGGEFSLRARPAVLVLPGGGYMMCSDREADPVALSYLKEGFHAFVLRYSVGRWGTWPNQLEDYEAAMACIRAHSGAWGVCPDKIAVVGFSAGGHLASCAATMAKERPNAAILGYAVTHGAIMVPGLPDSAAAVDGGTCPCFLFATRDDPLVPVRNTLDFAAALADHGVAFESHIYVHGPHGFSTAAHDIQDPAAICPRAEDWVADSVGFLREVFGDFPPAVLKRLRADPEG